MQYPFGPPVKSLDAPSEIVDFANRYVDRIVAKGVNQQFDYSAMLVGRVREEIELCERGVDEVDRVAYARFYKFVSQAVIEFAHEALSRRERRSATSTPQSYKIKEWSAWIVRQYAQEYNPVHSHLRFDISGVLYTVVPQCVKTELDDRASKPLTDGAIEFVYGSDYKFSPGRLRVIPYEGLMLLFPSFLYHVVYPFRDSDTERRCVAFNAIVLTDDEEG